MSGDKNKLTICEQTIEDPVSGFTFRFIVAAGESPNRILFKTTVNGAWREFLFDSNGEFSGAATKAAAEDAGARILRLVK